MLLHSVISTNSLWARSQRPKLPSLFRCLCKSTDAFTSVSSREGSCVDEDCNDFLPWLGNKAGCEISSLLSIGKSAYGRALCAAKDIQSGDCLLKVPYSVQLAPDNLPPGIACLLGDEVGDVAKVALLILYEKHLGKKSEWAPYISRLPLPEDMHSSVFWSDEELEMIRLTALYEETLKQKKQIEKDFLAVKLVSANFPARLQNITLQDFTYAYGLVTSRAWVSSRGVSMIPFADFLNHDGTSDSYVLSDEGRQHSEVIADRDFAPGDEVLIRYGKFSNATLLLDFGFTVSCNRYDQVRVELNVPQHDALYTQKLEILGRDRTPRIKDDNEFTYYENSFTIKKVGFGSRWGKGIPQSLRAFARIMACDSQQELHDLAKEAAENDGRLARKPLKHKNRELAAHQLLLSEMSRLIKDHDEHIKSLAPTPPTLREKSALRQKLALDLLSGELRVLKSASAWLENYCSRL
ncbi:ribulose-1,5 bisphosphate carboxylase/oxygenase large subunit N-methyltransferase, chloroplastic [Salvia hispanica]|uniref:ribulose-1,5 bisphosphate carboxylase/oxygenase large subunit N-methyltransferase, chloroplastic n=1 Tax=Salvia hispanica TaxID=49212 RepID=UPI002009CA40|nr:ribulose-1,5 bisphosphate carboxylase/oxygenase large subunit N-methyltransferase, chloroplastic [Salvia hispanica]